LPWVQTPIPQKKWYYELIYKTPNGKVVRIKFILWPSTNKNKKEITTYNIKYTWTLFMNV
jgi:hypothetical protein